MVVGRVVADNPLGLEVMGGGCPMGTTEWALELGSNGRLSRRWQWSISTWGSRMVGGALSFGPCSEPGATPWRCAEGPAVC